MVLSAKWFALDDFSFVKSLIYIKNKSGSEIDPWRTPALLTPAHKENWSFETVLCLLFFRKPVIKVRLLPELPFCFNLKIWPSYQTLSKALEIFKNHLELCCSYRKIGILYD